MDLYEMKAMVLRLTEDAWNLGNLNVIDELTAPDYLNHDPAYPMIRSRDDLKRHILEMHRTYPDFKLTYEEFIAEGNRVVMRWHIGGTQMETLPIYNLPPTGRHVTITGVTVYECVSNRLSRSWWYWDQLAVLQQLGAFHAPDAMLAAV